MKEFNFRGPIPASKSLMNRALIVKSFFPVLDIYGESKCDDVVHMQEALPKLKPRTRLDCGEGGTTFRFLALRASRIVGMHTLEAHPRLMQRPQRELVEILHQLGVQAQLKKNGLFMVSDGWKRPRRPLEIDSSDSSQYASSLLLNSWMLDFDLEFKLTGNKVSESYFKMTVDLVTKLGMRLQLQDEKIKVPQQERISQLSYVVEPDLSSAFVFAAAGALRGRCEILNFPEASMQPDRVFVDIFRKMNIPCELVNGQLVVGQASMIAAIDFNLSQAPDLFPVLAVVCSFANGVSKLYGAPHLAFKEANRIKKVSDLLSLIGVKHESLVDGMIIHGQKHRPFTVERDFDPQHDHRMVMAAALLKQVGYAIRILHPEAVNKSMPEFFPLFGVAP